MSQTAKHFKQMKQVKAAITFLNNEVSLISSYDELQTHLNKFMKFYTQQANEKNNRANKSLIGFINYFESVAPQKRSTEAVSKTARGKRLAPKPSYKDHLTDYQVLRARGYSYKAISDYSKQYFKVKVSKETVRTALKELD
jgi:hypothetical protein